jgi:subtilisin family serine protease
MALPTLVKSVAVTALFATASANAGEVLKLKAGAVRLQNASEQLLIGSFGANGFDGRHDQSGLEKYFVVQFEGAIPGYAKVQLESLGLQVLTYLPDDAYVVRGSARNAGLAKEAVDRVKAVAPYQAEWKVSHELIQSSRFGARAVKTQRILVAAFDAAASVNVQRQLAALGGRRLVRTGQRDLMIEIEASRVAEIAQIEGVEWIEELPIYVSYDYEVDAFMQATPPPDGYRYTGHESGTKLMNFDAAWNRGFIGKGQVVAVADTGLDSGKVSTVSADFVGNLIKGYAVGLGGTSWEDTMGHGTHVCGSVTGNGAASDGLIKGGAYGSNLVILSLWSDLLDNLAPGTDFEKIIGSAYPDGARIHTNSWGSPANPGAYDTMASRVDEYMWKHPDMLVLFAAGNDGKDLDADGRIDENSLGTPATAKNVLTVGASENEMAVGGIQKQLHELREGEKKWGAEPIRSDYISNNGNGMAAFSSRGPTLDGRLKPEIVAPGTNIISNRSHNTKAGKLWGEFNADYVYAGGTSMATPLTAGAASVAREFLVKTRGFNTPSGALVKATLIHTAKDMYPGQYGEGPKQELPTLRPNVHEGYGRVDMAQVMALGNETTIVDDAAGLGTSEEKTIQVNVAEGGSLRVTMTYTDAPASSAAAKALVNDLDVRVIAPSGDIRQLNDHINNTEMIEMSQLPAGSYRVVVKGNNVPSGNNGKQPYAMLVSRF